MGMKSSNEGGSDERDDRRMEKQKRICTSRSSSTLLRNAQHVANNKVVDEFR